MDLPDQRKHNLYVAPWLTCYGVLTELRSEAVHLLPGYQGPPAEVPARDFEVQRCPGRHMYVRLQPVAIVGSIQQQQQQLLLLEAVLRQEVGADEFPRRRHDR